MRTPPLPERVYEDRTPCGLCGQDCDRQALLTTHTTAPVIIHTCHRCDRIRCPACRNPIPGWAKRCPCGAPLPARTGPTG